MFYYRYRSGSELSIKELIYDELYFASREECNDPYEGKIFAILNNNEEYWNNLIRLALKFYDADAVNYLIERIIKFYVSKSPMYLDELLRTPANEIVNLGNGGIERTILKNMHNSIRQYVSLYIPAEQYFASFSKRKDNYLLWSHYANNHNGFCLIFRPINNVIQQNPNWVKKHLALVSTQGTTYMNLAIEDSFQIKDVEYVASPKCLDAFMCFPASVVGDKYGPSEIEDFQKEYSKIYFKKHKVWDYEEEARIVLSNGYPWMTGETMTFTPQQRLFHYDATQLVGIVLGTKMSQTQHNRIKEIVAEKVERWYLPTTGKRIISNFVLFEETLSETNREVIIEPKEIYTGTSVVTKKQPNFTQLYDEWQKGYAIEFNDGSSKKIIVE